MKIKNLVTCIMLQTAVIGSIYSMEDESEVNNNRIFTRSNSTNNILSNANKLQNIQLDTEKDKNTIKRLNSNDDINFYHADKTASKLALTEFEDLVEIKTYPHKFIYKINNTTSQCIMTLKAFVKKSAIANRKDSPTIINAIHIHNTDYVILQDKKSLQYNYLNLETKEVFESMEYLFMGIPYKGNFDIKNYNPVYNDTELFRSLIENDIIAEYISNLVNRTNFYNDDQSARYVIVDNKRYDEIERVLITPIETDMQNKTSNNKEVLYWYKGTIKLMNWEGKVDTHFILRHTHNGKEKYFFVKDSKTNNFYFMLQNHTNKPKFFNSIEDIIAGRSIDSKNIPQKYDYINDIQLLSNIIAKNGYNNNEYYWLFIDQNDENNYYKYEKNEEGNNIVNEKEENYDNDEYNYDAGEEHCVYEDTSFAEIKFDNDPSIKINKVTILDYDERPAYTQYYYYWIENNCYIFVYDKETNHMYYALVYQDEDGPCIIDDNYNGDTYLAYNLDYVVAKYYENIEDILNNNERAAIEPTSNQKFAFVSDNKINEFIKQKNLKVTYNEESNENQEIIKNSMSNNVELNNNILINNNEINNNINEEIVNNTNIPEINNKINNIINNENKISEENNINKIEEKNLNKDKINEIKRIEAVKSKLDDKSIKDKNNINEINIVEIEPRINDKIITNDKENINNIINNNDLNKDTNTSVNHNNNMKDNTIEQNKDVKFENLDKIMRTSNKSKSKISTVDEFLTKLSTEKEYKEKLRNSLASLKSKDDRSISTFLKEKVFTSKDISITPKICQAIIAYFDLLPQKVEKK